MTAVAQALGELFMMVLCVTAAPVEQQEIHVDLLSNGRFSTALVARREDTGFSIYKERKGKLAALGEIVPKKGVENVFVFREGSKSETIDLANGLKEFDLAQLRSARRLRLKASGGSSIAVDRSGGVTYITIERGKKTYVVH